MILLSLVQHSVARALQQLVEACKDDGPVLNFGKCKALWAYSINHPNYEPFCDAMGSYGEPIPIFYDAIPLLGAGVDWVPHEHGSAMPLFNSIPTSLLLSLILTCQSRLLCYCCVSVVSRLTYLTRVIPPAIIREACETFDAMIMRTVADKCHLPDPATNRGTTTDHSSISMWRDGIHTSYAIVTCSLLQFNGSLSTHDHQSELTW